MTAPANIDLVYGHRHAATIIALKLVLQPGEIGLVTADNSLWMRDYNSNYFRINSGAPSGAFGIKDGDSFDNTSAFNAALTASGLYGIPIILPSGFYNHTGTVNMPEGAALIGIGWGSLPTSAPTARGSILRYRGSGMQFSVNGSATRMEDFTLQDVNNTATCGLLLNADVNILESNSYKNILCYGHKAGRAKWMKAANNGYIAYNKFDNFRVRDAKYGIEITAPAGTGGDNAFVNSNTWRGGAMSGSNAIFTNCLLVNSGQDNNFEDITIEPYDSVDGHIWVKGGSINMTGLVLEGRDQLAKFYTGSPTVNTPHTLRFSAATIRSKVWGSGSGSSYNDLGANDIRMESSKAPQKGLNSSNILNNCIFKNIGASSVQDWSISGAGVTTAQVDFESKLLNHFTLKVTVPAGILCNVRQNLTTTELLARFSAAPLSFGAWVNFSGNPLTTVVAATVSDNTGTTTGARHTGDATYQWKGMSKQITSGPSDMSVAMSIDNTLGAAPVIVYITVPCAILGWWLPAPGATPLTNAGGVVDGTLTISFAKSKTAATDIVIAKEGNIVPITGATTIATINNLAADYLPKGTPIVLVFATAGCTVTSSANISLYRPFVSVAGGSLTLASNGDGTWQELWRNLYTLNSYEATALGGTAGNSQQIANIWGEVGNTFKKRVWAYRNANGADFTTARLHEAVSVDNSYATPHTDTRAYVEVDPNAGSRHWGHQTVELMTLKTAANGGHLYGPIRQQLSKGASIASANDITLGADGSSFITTGTTAINRITTTNWQAGSVIRLLLPASGVVAHNGASTSGALARILLNAAANFTAPALGGGISLCYNGTDWVQV